MISLKGLIRLLMLLDNIYTAEVPAVAPIRQLTCNRDMMFSDQRRLSAFPGP